MRIARLEKRVHRLAAMVRVLFALLRILLPDLTRLRVLMALSRVQEHVLGDTGLHTGDYSFFASQVECLFLTQ